MIYNNNNVRRQDRLLNESAATALLANGEYGVLSMTDTEGLPYGIPVNYVWDGKSALYIHCAPEGKKLRNITANPKVSFCVIGATNVISDKFTTEYESIVLRGEAHKVSTDDEKWNAIQGILEKYSPQDKTIGEKYATKSFHRVEIIRIDITEWSGKCKQMHKNAPPSGSNG